ncbi:glycosyltransferase family 4 protein [Raineyella sp. LH-20]|uniref:glycosyltransferase family 4 protein n=1 Tax=Raineyella sp. LH-20 TaxID=3081204 RepID=UPI0029530ED8|nr:glycosyltransferase family 4 protein [Raineyella sp. LH-20]WOP19682.1 glycosyltransferase family 4 protein [Raineyella sp. LH-20]
MGVTIDYQLRYHQGLEEYLVDDGWEVHIVSSPGATQADLAARNVASIHEVHMDRSPNTFRDLVALGKWVKLIRKLRPSVVLLGTPKAALLGMFASSICGVPRRIYEVHGLRLESASGLSRRFLSLLERITCRLATDVVPVSRSLAEAMANEKITAETKIRILGHGSPGGVDISHFATVVCDESLKNRIRQRLDLDSGIPVVIFVGRLTEDKGLAALSAAAGILSAARPVQFLIVGPVDDESGKAGVRTLTEAASRVTFTGNVDDVAPYLAVADVLCLPSRREGLPTVILEAFAAGVPVVATRATGVVDLVTDGRTGLLVPIDDPVALEDALERLLDDPEAARRLADSGREIVEAYFARADVHRRWTDFLSRDFGDDVDNFLLC